MAMTSSEIPTRIKTETNEEEYESVFAVELHGLFDEEAIRKAVEENKTRVHRINSGEPLLQIGSQLFVGRWEEVVGTDIIFREIPHRHLLNYVGINRKRLVAQRVVLVPKNKKEKETDVHQESTRPNMEMEPESAALKTVDASTDVEMTVESDLNITETA